MLLESLLSFLYNVVVWILLSIKLSSLDSERKREYGQIKKVPYLGRVNYTILLIIPKIGPLTMKVYDLCRDIQSWFDFLGINCSLLLLICSNLIARDG